MAEKTSMITKCIAEFVGTFFLVFTAFSNAITRTTTLSSSFAVGGVLLVAVQSLGPISGGHFNPAVSLSVALVKGMGGPGKPWLETFLYCFSQISAALLAAFICCMLYGRSVRVAPADTFSLLTAGACEYVYTFMLCFVVLNVAVARKGNRDNQFFAIAIGFALLAGIFTAGPVSGGLFNPALTLAMEITSSGQVSNGAYYMMSHVAGACTAAVMFARLRPEEFDRLHSPGRNGEMLLGEFIGTFMLVITVALNMAESSSSGPLAIGATLTSMVYAVGDVSGGLFNPAATLGVLCSSRMGDMTVIRAVFFMAVQILAGVAGATFGRCIYYDKPYLLSPALGPRVDVVQGLPVKFDMTQAITAEAIFTFLLCFTVLSTSVAERTKAPNFFGLAIGLSVSVGGLAVGKISGAALNPAVDVGVAHVAGGFRSAAFYAGAQLASAVVAAGALRMTHEVDFEIEETKPLV